MSRRNSPRQAQQEEQLSEAECEEYAEVFVDKILDPSMPLLRTCMLAGIESPEALKELARRIGFSRDPANPTWAKDLKDALEKMDREKLVSLAKTELFSNPPTGEQARILPTVDFGALMRNATHEAARMFTAKRGRKPKAGRREYPKIAKLGDKLYPICLKMLTEQRFETHHSVRKLLELWKQDFPKACTFLLHHVGRFESMLKDKRLRKRATRIESFAHLLADGMAGADYGLKPRTSIERAREGRRLTTRLRN
jgi:hypothetical protein